MFGYPDLDAGWKISRFPAVGHEQKSAKSFDSFLFGIAFDVCIEYHIVMPFVAIFVDF